jgi:hypothetical protein
MAIIGCIVAIVVVKQFFGGIGHNFVNPAITARIVLTVSFASAMTNWIKPLSVDAITTATPLSSTDFDVNKLAEILSTDDEQKLAKVAKKAKVTTTSVPGVRQSARKKQFDDLKQYITVGNEELKQAFEDWIDGVYNNPKGFLSKKAVSLFQRDVDTFANGDLDVALKVLEIATVGGYREASWAIEKFNKDYANQFRRRYVVPTTSPTRNVVVSDEVF